MSNASKGPAPMPPKQHTAATAASLVRRWEDCLAPHELPRWAEEAALTLRALAAQHAAPVEEDGGKLPPLPAVIPEGTALAHAVREYARQAVHRAQAAPPMSKGCAICNHDNYRASCSAVGLDGEHCSNRLVYGSRDQIAPAAAAAPEPVMGGRESVEEALAVVEGFGPGIHGLNDTYARQILLADEVRRLRAAPGAAAAAPSTTLQARATDLHEKAGMPWHDAERLALSEQGIDDAAVDELIGECGGLDSILCTPDELRAFTRSVLVHQATPGAAAAAQPVLPDLEALDIAFSRGVCVALQVITTMDCGTTWREVVQTCDEAKLLHFAAHVEPEEWELAGFAQYAREELGRDKPAAQAQGAVPPSGGAHG